MYEYISKFSVRKPQNADSEPAAEHIKHQRFAIVSSKPKSSEDISFLDEKIHERIFGKPNKTDIPDDSKNGAETLSEISRKGARVNYDPDKPVQMHSPSYEQGMYIRKRAAALRRTETSDTISRETSETAEPHKAVVQRLLDTNGLDPKKHGNIIVARNLWNGVFNELCQILPLAQQAAFQNAVNAYENANLTNRFAIPNDGDYAAMAVDFVSIITIYLNTPHSTDSMTAAALGAGGSVHVMKNTGGHTNTQTRIAIQTVGGGLEFFDTGDTREHGKQTSRKKQHQQKRERDDAKNALRIERIRIAAQVDAVYQRLLANNMAGAAAVLQRFMEDNG